MFTIKQQTGAGDKLWPGAKHVFTESINCAGSIDRVTAMYENGDLHDFDISSGTHIIYVMNENGSTVARYNLGNRANCPASGTLADLPEPIAA